MSNPPSATLTDQEVLRRLQYIGDALTASTGHGGTSHLNPYRTPHRSPGDWRQQRRLLEDLAALLSDDVASRPAFVGWMSLYLKNALAALLLSQQTAVSRGCMAVLDCLVVRSAAAHRSSVAAVCSWFLTPLLRLAASVSAASIITGTATRLLLSLAQSCLITLEGLNTLFTACAAASAPVRRCALHILQAYLQAARGTSHQLATSAYTEALHRVLRDGVADADAEVRAGARRCFWTLHLLEPASAAVVLHTLPHNVRYQLEAERADTLKELQAVVAGADETSTAVAAPPARQHRPSRSPRRADVHVGVSAASRTVTLKDELQAAAASRARAQGSRSPSPANCHQQLLLLAKDHPYDPDRRPVSLTAAAAAPKARHGAPPTSLLSAMESSDWSVRRAALLRARQLCEEDRLADELPALVPILLLRLQDAHFRVVEAAQEVLQCCLRMRPSATQQLLHAALTELVGTVVRNTIHAKATVRDGAYVLLDVLARHCTFPAQLIEAVARCVDDVHDSAVVQRGAEYLHYVLLVHFSLLAQVAVMSGVVRCCVVHLLLDTQERTGQCGEAWARVLAVAALAAPDAFNGVYGQLSREQQDVAQAALQGCLGVVSATDADGSMESLPEVPCAFAEQLRSSHAAERKRLSAMHKRSRDASPGTAEFAAPLSLPSTAMTAVSRRALHPSLRKLLAKADGGSDAPSPKAVSQAQGGSESQPQGSADSATEAPQAKGMSSPVAPPAVAETSHLSREHDAGMNTAGRVPSALPQPFMSDDAPSAPPRNPPGHFLREWATCKETATKRAALRRLSSALAHYTARQRSSSGLSDGVQPECLQEDVEQLLVLWEREVAGADYGNDHLFRWAVFEALEALLHWPASRPAITRQLHRVVVLCRVGVDDAFLEVQLQAATCLETALRRVKVPCDLCLGAVTTCLLRWMEGPSRDAASPGYVALLHVTRQLFEDGRQRSGGREWKGGPERPSSALETDGAALTLPASVLRRVTAVVCVCLNHCNPVVRLSAVLVLVAVRQTMGETTTAPFLTALTPAQQRVVDVYQRKALEVADDAAEGVLC